MRAGYGIHVNQNFSIDQSFLDALKGAGAGVFLVGGSVRDRLMGLPQKDLDFLITRLDYEAISKILRPLGSLNFVGKSFGVIKFRPKSIPDVEYDLSLPRIEKSTGEGHKDFKVDFDKDIPVEKDLARRDFTVNAIALDLIENTLVDPFGGQQDIQNKILRQVFAGAFEEDPLRLMRAVQFSARLGFKIEDETLSSMKRNADKIRTVSKERIIEEIKKLFMAPQPSDGFDLMRDTGILKIVFPFIQKMIGIIQPKKQNEDVYDHTMKVLNASRSAIEMERPGDLEIMFSALLHDVGKPATYKKDPATGEVTFYAHQVVSKKIARRWLDEYKITCIGLNPNKILHLVEHHMFETKAFYSERAIRRFVNKVGVENIFDLLDLRIADKKGGRYPNSMRGIMKLRDRIREEVEKKPPFGAKDLAVNGHDLMNMGYEPGPLLGKIMNFLVDKVLDEPELNVKEVLMKMVAKEFPPA